MEQKRILPYELSTDYNRLKELLDNGNEIVCFSADRNDASNKRCFLAKKTGDALYTVTSLGVEYAMYDKYDSYNGSYFSERMAEANIEFIDIPQKAYIITRGEYEEEYIDVAYTKKEDAEKYNSRFAFPYPIEEFKLNALDVNALHKFDVTIKENGKCKVFDNNHLDNNMMQKGISRYDEYIYRVTIEAYNPEEAMQKAMERHKYFMDNDLYVLNKSVEFHYKEQTK